MKKYIVLVPDKSKYTFKYVNSELCDFYNVYKRPNVNIVLRLFRKFVYFIGLGVFNVFYDDWTKFLNRDVQFIVFDGCRPYHRLKNKLKKAKIKPVIYYWNPISKDDKIEQLKRDFRVSAYSVYDVERYKVEYNPTFYVDTHVVDDGIIEYDAIFLGRNKSRLNLLEKVYGFFDKSYFYVVKDSTENSSILDLKTSLMPYEDYLKLLVKSKAIIEILYSDNADYTLRTMEAIFYQKKLITNNNLIADAAFYNANNIFILNDNTTKEDINRFLALPFIPYSDELVSYYDVDNWLRRFDI